jgi:hypothetical protein
MITQRLWGSIAANGAITNSSGGFTVSNTGPGVYTINFTTPFLVVPAVVATQNNFGSTGESNVDGVAVPVVTTSSAQFVTGDSAGNKGNRAFGFTAIGIYAQAVASFEILAQPIAPGVPNVAYVQQGFFTQITNLNPGAAVVNLIYDPSPAFVTSNGAIDLFINIIDQTGGIMQYPINTFMTAPVGFKNISIPSAGTFLFGVQYLLLPTTSNPAILTPATGGTPQNSQSARGMLSLQAPPTTSLMVLSTIRQVFTNYSPTSTSTNPVVLDIAEAAYAVPQSTGPLVSF